MRLLFLLYPVRTIRRIFHHLEKIRTSRSYFFMPCRGLDIIISTRLACRTRDTRLTFHYANKFARSTITAVANRAAYEPRQGHQKPIIRTQIMGSYYFFFENFLLQNYAYKFKEFIKTHIVAFVQLKRPLFIYTSAYTQILCVASFMLVKVPYSISKLTKL